jgi:hypothetical protein
VRVISAQLREQGGSRHREQTLLGIWLIGSGGV